MRRTIGNRHPQLQSLRGPNLPLRCCEGMLNMFLILFTETCLNKYYNVCFFLNMILMLFTEICPYKYYYVCFLIPNVVKLFQFLRNFIKDQPDLCETNTVVVLLSKVLPVGAGCCINHNRTKKSGTPE